MATDDTDISDIIYETISAMLKDYNQWNLFNGVEKISKDKFYKSYPKSVLRNRDSTIDIKFKLPELGLFPTVDVWVKDYQLTFKWFKALRLLRLHKRMIKEHNDLVEQKERKIALDNLANIGKV